MKTPGPVNRPINLKVPRSRVFGGNPLEIDIARHDLARIEDTWEEEEEEWIARERPVR